MLQIYLGLIWCFYLKTCTLWFKIQVQFESVITFSWKIKFFQAGEIASISSRKLEIGRVYLMDEIIYQAKVGLRQNFNFSIKTSYYYIFFFLLLCIKSKIFYTFYRGECYDFQIKKQLKKENIFLLVVRKKMKNREKMKQNVFIHL